MNTQLTDIKPGLALVLFGLALGVVLGVGFGLYEDAFQDFISEGIAAHPEVHNSKSQHKIWRYVQRAHFHFTGIAAFSIGLLLLVSASTIKRKLKKVTSILIGLGVFYPVSWLSIFFLAPSIGRKAAHSHIIAELFAIIGVGGLTIGILMLVANVFFGLLEERKPE